MMNTTERARGRWKEILPHLGIEEKFLTKRHGPCPLCGGEDRFFYDDKDGSGSYFCRQCGAGVGMILIRKKHGWNHKTACDEVDKIIGDAPIEPVPQKSTKRAGNPDRMQRYLDDARSRDVVDNYFRARGPTSSSPVLRGSRRHPYYREENGKSVLVGYYPCILAPIVAPDGELRSVHQIFDADLDPRKKTMVPVDTINGAAVRLYAATDELGICEGIETGEAVHELFGVPVWACLTAGGLERFEPPQGIRRLRIFGDNDLSFTGQAAAYALAKRIVGNKKRYPGISVQVDIPLQSDADWLDVFNENGWQA